MKFKLEVQLAEITEMIKILKNSKIEYFMQLLGRILNANLMVLSQFSLEHLFIVFDLSYALQYILKIVLIIYSF